MLSLLKRDARKNLFFYLMLMAEILACVIVLGILFEPLVLGIREKLSDDRQNYQCYSDYLQGSFVSEEEFYSYMDSLSYNGEKVVYGLYNNGGKSLDRSVTERESKDGLVSYGVTIDKTVAAHMKLNNVTGEWFSADYPQDYREILVNEAFRDTYKIGKIYEESELGRVKVIGYLRYGINFQFYATGRVDSGSNGYLLCSEVRPNLVESETEEAATAMLVFSPLDLEYLSTLPFVRGEIENPDRYASYDDVYGAHKNSYRDAVFMVVVIDVIFMISVATNTVINKRKNTKINACYFLCGATSRQIVAFELLKMALLFFIPFALVLVFSPLLITMTKFRYLMLASGILFITYLLPQCMKIASIFTANHLNVLRGVR